MSQDIVVEGDPVPLDFLDEMTERYRIEQQEQRESDLDDWQDGDNWLDALCGGENGDG